MVSHLTTLSRVSLTSSWAKDNQLMSLIMVPDHKSNDTDNLDMSKTSHNVFPLSDKGENSWLVIIVLFYG